jgi:hypothetical protein
MLHAQQTPEDVEKTACVVHSMCGTNAWTSLLSLFLSAQCVGSMSRTLNQCTLCICCSACGNLGEEAVCTEASFEQHTQAS